jgi:demethylmenaquinone methyltransferase/2-methoxy-6-polyprenyl-1,4-benzoquinol methylase
MPVGHDRLLKEQIRYYRALAAEYEEHPLELPGEDELLAAVDSFRPKGDVLELACGRGLWTERLLDHAATLTAVDAAPEMLAIASARIEDERVRFVEADIFSWRPEHRYDAVFFGFWLSHVPLDRFEGFWSLVADCLEEDGRVMFVDDGYRTAGELIEGEASSTIRRRLNDGSTYRAVKVPHDPASLERRLDELGWQIEVKPTSGPFFWGAGGRA